MEAAECSPIQISSGPLFLSNTASLYQQLMLTTYRLLCTLQIFRERTPQWGQQLQLLVSRLSLNRVLRLNNDNTTNIPEMIPSTSINVNTTLTSIKSFCIRTGTTALIWKKSLLNFFSLLRTSNWIFVISLFSADKIENSRLKTTKPTLDFFFFFCKSF